MPRYIFAESLYARRRVLEVGAVASTQGQSAKFLEARGARLVVAADDDLEAVQTAQQKLAGPTLRFRPTVFDDFESGSFDLVMVADLAPYVPAPELLRELARLVAKNGYLMGGLRNPAGLALAHVVDPEDGAAPPTYGQLLDALSNYFPSVEVATQSPVLGYQLAFERGEGLQVDGSLAGTSEAAYFVVIAGQEAVRSFDPTWVQLPPEPLAFTSGKLEEVAGRAREARERSEKLKGVLAKKTEEFDAQRLELKEAQERLEAASEGVSRLTAQLEAAQERPEHLRDREELAVRIQRLEAELEVARQRAVDAEGRISLARAELEAQVRAQQESTATALASQEQARLERARREELVGQLEDTRARLTQAHEELSSAQEEAGSARLDQQRSALTLERFKEALASKDADLAQARERELRLAQGQSEALAAVEHLKKNLELAEVEHEKTRVIAREQEAERHSAVRALETEEKKRLDLIAELERERAHVAALEEDVKARLAELAARDTELQGVQAAHARALRDVETVASSERHFRELALQYEARLNDTTNDVQQLSDQVAQLESAKDTEVARARRLELDLTTAVTSERSARERAETELVELRTTTTELGAAREALTVAVTSERSARERAETDLAELRATVTELTAAREALSSRGEALERELTQREAARLSSEVDLERLAKDHAVALREAEQKDVAFARERETHFEARRGLEEALAGARAEAAQLTVAVGDVGALRRQLDAATQDMTGQLASFVAREQELLAERDGARRELEALAAKHGTLESDARLVGSRAEELEAQVRGLLAEAREDETRASEAREDFEARLAVSSREVEDLRAKATAALAELDEVKAELTRRQEAEVELKNELEAARRAHQRAEGESSQLVQRLAEHTKALADAEPKLAEVSAQLELAEHGRLEAIGRAEEAERRSEEASTAARAAAELTARLESERDASAVQLRGVEDRLGERLAELEGLKQALEENGAGLWEQHQRAEALDARVQLLEREKQELLDSLGVAMEESERAQAEFRAAGEARHAEFQSSEWRFAEQQARVASLRAELDQALRGANDARAAVTTANQTAARLEGQLDATRSALDAAQRQAEERATALAAAEAELGALQGAFGQGREEAERAREDREAFVLEVQRDYEAKLAAATRERERVEALAEERARSLEAGPEELRRAVEAARAEERETQAAETQRLVEAARAEEREARAAEAQRLVEAARAEERQTQTAEVEAAQAEERERSLEASSQELQRAVEAARAEEREAQATEAQRLVEAARADEREAQAPEVQRLVEAARADEREAQAHELAIASTEAQAGEVQRAVETALRDAADRHSVELQRAVDEALAEARAAHAAELAAQAQENQRALETARTEAAELAIEAAPTPPAGEPQLVDAEGVVALKKELEETRRSLAAQTEAHARALELASAEAEAALLARERELNDAARRALAAQTAEHLRALQAQVGAREGTIDDAINMARAEAREAVEARDRSLIDEVQRLSSELSESDAQKVALERELRRARELSEEQRLTAASQLEALQQQVEQLREGPRTDGTEPTLPFDAELARLAAKVSKFEAAAGWQQALEGQLAAWRGRAEAMEAEQDALRRQNLELEETLAQAKNGFELADDSTSNSQRVVAAAEERAALAESEVATLQDRVATLESELIDAQAPRVGLDEELAKFKRRLAQVEAELEITRARLPTDVSAALAARQQAEEMLFALRTRYGQLQREVEDARGDLVEARAERDLLEHERERLASQLEEVPLLRSRISRLEADTRRKEKVSHGPTPPPAPFPRARHVPPPPPAPTPPSPQSSPAVDPEVFDIDEPSAADAEEILWVDDAPDEKGKKGR